MQIRTEKLFRHVPDDDEAVGEIYTEYSCLAAEEARNRALRLLQDDDVDGGLRKLQPASQMDERDADTEYQPDPASSDPREPQPSEVLPDPSSPGKQPPQSESGTVDDECEELYDIISHYVEEMSSERKTASNGDEDDMHQSPYPTSLLLTASVVCCLEK